jgi:hypothetical protein
MLGWILAAVAVVYGISLLVMRDRWMSFFTRIDNRDRPIPAWLPQMLAGGAFLFAIVVLVIL